MRTSATAIQLGIILIIGIGGAHAQGQKTRYERCFTSLEADERPVNVLKPVVQDINKRPITSQKQWRVNQPFDITAYNLLLPKTSQSRWIEAHIGPCLDFGPQQPRCLSIPDENTIICNPKFTERVLAPEIGLGAFNAQTVLAARFLVTAILGHEIGHLELGKGPYRRHFYDFSDGKTLKCTDRSRLAKSEEERADEYGLKIACDTIRSNRVLMQNRPGSVSGGVVSVSQLLQTFDGSYYSVDDMCAGDKIYPSISRRKHTFAAFFVQCLYPLPIEYLQRFLPERDAKQYRQLERWVTNRQLDGFAASGSFGKSSVYRHVILSTSFPASYVTLELGGTGQLAIWITTVKGGTISTSIIKHKITSGSISILDTFKMDSAVIAILRLEQNERTKYIRLSIKCGQDGAKKCKLGQTVLQLERNEVLISASQNGVITIKSGRLRLYGPSSVQTGHMSLLLASALPVAKNLSRDDHAIGLHSKNAIIIQREPLKSGTSLVTRVSANGNRNFRIRIQNHPNARIEAVRLDKERVRILFSSENGDAFLSPLNTLGVGLLECPRSPLAHSSIPKELHCTLRLPPVTSLVLPAGATRDLSTLSLASIEESANCKGVTSINYRGLVWLVDESNQTSDVLLGNQVIRCDPIDNAALVYRNRRIDKFKLSPTISMVAAHKLRLYPQ